MVAVAAQELLELTNMAQCKGCKASVGCGCQLVNGLCSVCRAAAKKFKALLC